MFMESCDIRKMFLDFFKSRGHMVLPPAPLVVPCGDTLFVSAGMQPLMPIFQGKLRPPASSIVTAQPCLRMDDIEKVGHTPYHHTLFEMLGNFSFGGYGKKEAIEMAWDLLINKYRLSSDALCVTVYEDDDESFEIWNKYVGLTSDKIKRLGKETNWWPQKPWVGPCGPCTEIMVGNDEENGLELWNIVFQTYWMGIDGGLTPLPKMCIDTGMGLERLSLIIQGCKNDFETDIFSELMQAVQLAIPNADMESKYCAADHCAAIAALLSEGITPSNKLHGYVLRKLIRRVATIGFVSGLILKPFISSILPSDIVEAEENKFCVALRRAKSELDKMAGIKNSISKEQQFFLYDTFGLPYDLIEKLCMVE